MSEEHVLYINKLKKSFISIIELKHNAIRTIQEIGEKLLQLKNKYNELVKTNTKKIFLFCFDSFFSQYKTFIMELEHFDKSKALLNNRTYCDFYKLYNIILAYCKDNRNDFNISNELLIKSADFTAYKDLEPLYEYDINEIISIHENIILLIDALHNNYLVKEETKNDYSLNHKIGFTISNFINTLDHENVLLKQQISLFLNFLSFFQISQKKQLDRLLIKLNEFFNEVVDNLDNNKTFSVDDLSNDSDSDSSSSTEPDSSGGEDDLDPDVIELTLSPNIEEETAPGVEEYVTQSEETVVVEEEPVLEEQVVLEEEQVAVLEEPVVEEVAVLEEEQVAVAPVVEEEQVAVAPVVEEVAVAPVEEQVVEEPVVEEPVVEEVAVAVVEEATVPENSVVEEVKEEIPEIPEIPEILEIP